tara:strand:+ start:7777 stop:9402 length:1626 start_codon:yes stop_codon:yes gene_type:complete
MPTQIDSNPSMIANEVSTKRGLGAHGLKPQKRVHWNPSASQLYEWALIRGEGRLAHGGGFTAVTIPHTGRSPNDRFIVKESTTDENIDWGNVNIPLSEEHFFTLRNEVIEFLNEQDLFVRDAKAGASREHEFNVRVVTQKAWHNLFAYNMFLRPTLHELNGFQPDFTVLHAPDFQSDPKRHGTNSGAFIVLNLQERQVIIGGSNYAGEIKKSIFSALNYMLPSQGVLPMHCSANVGSDGNTSLFFGLSGTGKTTLSADPERGLIGDDEHGWNESGIFNFEGGCYAKAISLSPEGEPEIYQATNMFGTIIENVVLDENTREINFDDGSITENTRSSYPIHYIPNAVVPGLGGHPKDIFFLTADAFGVLPPIAKLSPEQAMYHFISGYTAKVSGTERDITEPKATFSACFGAPFLPRHPAEYADLLGERLRKHGSNVWLINTGWIGGGYGSGGRISLSYTRTIVNAVLSGDLKGIDTKVDPIFDLHIPVEVPGIPTKILSPRDTWADKSDYDAAAHKLAAMFKENFSYFEGYVPKLVKESGPR